MSLEEGIKALEQKNYPLAVKLLEDFCRQPSNKTSVFYVQALMALARAYRGNNQRNQALSLVQSLQNHPDAQLSRWAKGFISILAAEEKTSGIITSGVTSGVYQKAPRASQQRVRLKRPKIRDNLNWAYLLTIVPFLGIVFAVCFPFVSLFNKSLLPKIVISGGISLGVNLVICLIAPLVLELSQQWFFELRWVNLAEIKRKSPESALVIQRICREKKIKPPRLGIIDDKNPTAFTYGSLFGSPSLLVTEGLFNYLDEDEIATVYAHELGHIVHRDFPLMMIGATFIHITYPIYLWGINLGNKNNYLIKFIGKFVAVCGHILYLIPTYFILYLSRTREYFADHFATETTGNPNGLSRALVKIAAGMVEQWETTKQTSKLLALTRTLGIYDYKTSLIPGTAYRGSIDPRKMGQVFLWELFNPWGWWLGLNSSHPLTGKRLGHLAIYAEQLELTTEFNLSKIIREKNSLDRAQLYGHFILDALIFNCQWIGSLLGLILGMIFTKNNAHNLLMISLIVLGYGIGNVIKGFIVYPKLTKPNQSSIYKLIADPYASPLRGTPVELKGKILTLGEKGGNFQLQDWTGTILARYHRPLGNLGSFLFTIPPVEKLTDSQVSVLGWFRRGLNPWIDWHKTLTDNGTFSGYPRLSSFVFGGLTIVVGFVLLILALGTRIQA